MATSTIKYDLTTSSVKVTPNYNYTTNDNNILYVFKVGRIVFLSGTITNTYNCPQYTWLFAVPDGYKPAHPLSIVPLNQTTNEWFFAGYDGQFSPQSANAVAGARYFTAMWIAA